MGSSSCPKAPNAAVWGYVEASRPAHVQGQLLEKLRGVPHVVRLVAQGSCTFNGTDWHALLLGPLVTHLTASDKLLLAAQVGEGGGGAVA